MTTERTHSEPGRDVTVEEDVETTDETLSPPTRASWGAIFAGTAVALAVAFIIGLLGSAIALGSFDPATEQDSIGNFGAMTGAWIVIQIVVSLFAGGWVAGRLANKPRSLDGMLNSGVVWALTTLLFVVGFASFASTAISGTATVVREGVSAVTDVAGAAAGAVGGVLDQADIDVQRGQIVSTIQQEGRQVLQQSGKQELQPAELRQEAQALEQLAVETAGDVAQSPQQAGQVLDQAISQAFTELDGTVEAADQQALVNILTARTNLSEQEARQTVQGWVQTFENAMGQLQQIGQNLGQEIESTAATVATDVTDALAKAMWWTLFGLVLGLIAALGGGWIGSPKLEKWRKQRVQRRHWRTGHRHGPPTPA